jgi:hypothetical protein
MLEDLDVGFVPDVWAFSWTPANRLPQSKSDSEWNASFVNDAAS